MFRVLLPILLVLTTGINTVVPQKLPKIEECGLQRGTGKIFGGVLTDVDEFPWMALLGYRHKITGRDVGFLCGGSLINKRYVLTAGHCTKEDETKLTSVRLGEWNISSPNDCSDPTNCADPPLDIKVEKIIPYPSYRDAVVLGDDISLIKLERDVEYTDFIRPVCLPTAEAALPPLADGTNLTVVGWGLTENDTSFQEKRKVDVPLKSLKECNDVYVDVEEKTIGEKQICAGVIGKDSCSGDSGGPIMRLVKLPDQNSPQWFQEGVVSWGQECATDHPGIYTRVTSYMDWILETI